MLQYQYIVPSGLCVSDCGRKMSKVSVMSDIRPKIHTIAATEITAGNTIASPAQKLACQRAKKLLLKA